MDQEISYFKFPHKTKKWWKAAFYHLLEITINNSRILYQAQTKKTITMQKFRENIVDGLLIGWSRNLLERRTHLMINNPNLNPALPAINLCYLHDIKKDKGGRGNCEYCSTAENRTRTAFKCNICGKYLYAEKCFLAYHKEYVYKY